MTQRLSTLLEDLGRVEQFDSRRRAEFIEGCPWVRQATTQELRELLWALRRLTPPRDPDVQTPLTAVLGHLAARLRASAGPSTERQLWAEIRTDLVALYQHLGHRSTGRHHLLVVLAASGSQEDLEAYSQLVATDPPARGDLAVLTFAPLFQHPSDALRCLFPRLLDGLQHPSVAAPILDLANFATRRNLVAEHPAARRSKQLAVLLGELVQRLGLFEQQARTDQFDPQQMAADHTKVAESLALTVSLCDALALIGDKSAVSKLHQAMDLGHRQVRTEAAAALARMGEEAGSQTLVAMAAQPVVRLRALAYAEELGLLGEIAREHRSAVARAEAELVFWLTQPTQAGLPPQKLDLIDSRKQFWPSYDEPVDCYLFRYTYQLPEGPLSNVAIAGPLVHGFAADFTDLPTADIYAAFAGWHAEHEEILELDAQTLPAAHQPLAEIIRRRLETERYDSLQVVQFGLFFGQLVLIGTAVHNGAFGAVIADGEKSYWCPQAEGKRPLTPHDAYNIYKGRKLLEAFNN
jgi:hypothetical protein